MGVRGSRRRRRRRWGRGRNGGRLRKEEEGVGVGVISSGRGERERERVPNVIKLLWGGGRRWEEEGRGDKWGGGRGGVGVNCGVGGVGW